ncbi:Rapamycin-insensitive companion of mTOR [Merluccius polli]|uniref:Rapamycin-insensitive companion of mTOR n=1 Tax=Merluccius polli TaxID=89951 RepID=A0AA47NXQ9_MERPO|nr:Rapamycin-insensitive companion of mTOR [Merluccius polli]
MRPSGGGRTLTDALDRGPRLRHTQSLRAPSSAALVRSASLGRGSSRDTLGYATLRRLQQQRMHPFLSRSEALASPAKDVLFADAIGMKAGCPGARFVKALSRAAFDREDLLCPINHSTLQRSSSWRAMATSDSAGGLQGDDFVGIALPVDITNMLHIKEVPYFQKTLSSPAEGHFYGATSDGPGGGVHQAGVDSQLGAAELHKTEPRSTAGPEDTGLQEHSDDNCLYCSGFSVLGLKSRNSHPAWMNVDCEGLCFAPDLVDGPLFSEWCGTSSHHLEALVQARFSGTSGSTLSQCSAGSGHSAELVLGRGPISSSGVLCRGPISSSGILDSNVFLLVCGFLGGSGGKSIPENGPSNGVLLRKEVLRLVVNLSSSVGTKVNESSLLTIKEKFPHAFDDVCLYSEISNLLAHRTFRLHARRFIQELFQDVSFLPVSTEARSRSLPFIGRIPKVSLRWCLTPVATEELVPFRVRFVSFKRR